MSVVNVVMLFWSIKKSTLYTQRMVITDTTQWEFVDNVYCLEQSPYWHTICAGNYYIRVLLIIYVGRNLHPGAVAWVRWCGNQGWMSMCPSAWVHLTPMQETKVYVLIVKTLTPTHLYLLSLPHLEQELKLSNCNFLLICESPNIKKLYWFRV